MDQPSAEELDMLDQAIEKSTKFLRELERQQADLDKNPPKIPAADLSAGRTAMQNAIASARRTVTALQDARKLAHDSDSESDS